MPTHIYNGDRIIEGMINNRHTTESKLFKELTKITEKYQSEELTEDIRQLKETYKNIIREEEQTNNLNNIKIQSKNIEIKSVIRQRIHTFKADQYECPDIRRYWHEMEVLSIARSMPEIEEYLKEIYGNNYTTLNQKLTTYKSIINDIKYRTDIILNNHYNVEHPEQKKFINETLQKISKIPLVNEEIKKIGLLLELFTNLGDQTVPSTMLANSRGKYRKVEYDQNERNINRTFIEGAGEQ